MKNWSTSTLPPKLSAAKIYFDTNFLLYLYSADYPGINIAFTTLKDNALFEGRPLFAELTASQYVLFEFFENRKKKHYQDFLAQQGININTETLDDGEIYSTYQKFNYFKVEDHNYIDIFPQIQQLVETDLSELSNFAITHESHVLNEKLFIPTKQFCLSSRVSRHDCLITSSAIFPNAETTNFDINIWTNDEDYKKGYLECTEISNIFSTCEINIEFIRSLSISTGKQLNLLHEPDFGNIPDFVITKLIDYLIRVNRKNFIGYTEQAPAVQDVIYVQNANVNLTRPKASLTIIGKDLDFIINSSYIEEFWHNGNVLTVYPINTNDVISCKWTFPDAFRNEFNGELDTIMTELKRPGHLVFVNDYYEEY